MHLWSITLYDPTGVTATVENSEAQFIAGTETATDVFTVTAEGVIARHAGLCIRENGLQVEDLGGGTLVSGRSAVPVAGNPSVDEASIELV